MNSKMIEFTICGRSSTIEYMTAKDSKVGKFHWGENVIKSLHLV